MACLKKISPKLIDSFTVSKGKKGDYFLNYDGQKLEIQSPWLDMDGYKMQNKKYINDISVSMTVDLEGKFSDMYLFFDSLTNFLTEHAPIPNKTLHKFIIEKDGKYYAKFKLYPSTTKVFVGKTLHTVTSTLGFYKYLSAPCGARLVFSLSKSWSLNSEYGFSLVVERIQLDEETFHESVLDQINFADSD